jgi:hypothetical protein
VVGQALPGMLQAGGRQLGKLEMPLGLGKSKDPFMDIPANPGGMRAGEQAPIVAPAIEDAPPPDPLQLLRDRVAEMDAAEQAGGRGRTAAQAPGGRGPLDEGDFIEGEPGAPLPDPPPRMAERVAATLEEADKATTTTNGPRIMEGTMTPDELKVYGIPLTPGQRALLTASAGDEAAGATARELMGRESAQASQPFGGQGVRNVHDAQQQAATNFITRELGLDSGVNLTDPVLADITAQLGDGFDDMARMMGDVPMGPEIRSEFDDILKNARHGHRSQIQGIVDQIGAFAEQNGGNLSGQHWQEIRTEIGKMITSGTKQGDMGKISDAGDLMETMTKAMEGSLPDAARAELRKMRHQYAIAMNLFKPGARNIADGQVNPLSFYNKWNQGRSNKTRGTDPVGRFMNTMVTLTQKRMPDSGTAGRLLEAAGQLPVVGGIARGIQTARNL